MDTMPPSVYTAIRVSIGFVYLWFGFLKFPFVPGGSPALPLLQSFDSIIPASTLMLILAVFETVMGLMLILGVVVQIVAAILFLHVLGTFSTVFLETELLFNREHGLYSLTLAGEFVVKNLFLLAALFALATTKPRRYPRSLYITPGRVEVGGHILPMVTRNISQRGLSFRMTVRSPDEKPQRGDRITLWLSLPSRAAEQELHARVIHVSMRDSSQWVVGCELVDPNEVADAFLDDLHSVVVPVARPDELGSAQ